MSEPYDLTRPADADRGLVRDCDRTGREWTEPEPDVVWWEGATECDLCGWTGRSVGSDPGVPVVPLECPGRTRLTLHPA